jgi:asparagine synthase (glutamine-hydrolysing)
MCGVVGIYRPLGAAVSPAILTEMAATLRHRGPDGAGGALLAEGRLGLAHLRLALVDPEGGAQPICNEDRSIWAVVNGEIYEHEALGAALRGRGHTLRSRSDAEVLVHLYEEQGIGCFAGIDGEFAALIWDGRLGRLVAVRDAAGVRPLLCRRHKDEEGEAWLFASEAKAIFAYPGVVRAFSPEYLTGPPFGAFGAFARGGAAFVGLESVAPGSAWIVDAQGHESRVRWWEPRFFVDDGGGERRDREATKAALAAALERSVQRRMAVEAPLGCLLSGGVDSTIIAGLAAKQRAGVAAFHLSFVGSPLDESAGAAAAARRFGLEMTTVEASAEVMAAALPAALRAIEGVIVNPHAAARYVLMQAVRAAGVKAVLTGEGADEWWGGYAWFLLEALWRRAGEPAADSALARLVARESAGAEVLWSSSELWRRGPRPLGWPCFFHLRALGNEEGARRLLREGQAWVAAARPSAQALAGHDLGDLQKMAPGDASRLLAMDQLAGYILPALGDRVELAHGVEGRPAFLGREVVRLAQETPSSWLWEATALAEKSLLREAFDGLLGGLAAGPKRPFFAPSWLALAKTRAGALLVEEHLSAAAVQTAGIFAPEVVAGALPRWLGSTGEGATSGRLDRMFGVVLSGQIVAAELLARAPEAAPAGFELVWAERRGPEEAARAR